jgi:hypothetical protein
MIDRALAVRTHSFVSCWRLINVATPTSRKKPKKIVRQCLHSMLSLIKQRLRIPRQLVLSEKTKRSGFSIHMGAPDSFPGGL